MLKYRPEIDGLRAVAVIGVILFHMNLEWVRGGYLGVDVFFVISGFLITSIILKELDNATFSMISFMLRRAKRILPALLCMLITTLLLGEILLHNIQLKTLGKDALASILTFANVNAWLMSLNYWGIEAHNSFFIHTWSLSLEEQYYIIFPLLCLFLNRHFTKYFGIIILIYTIIGFLFFLYLYQNKPVAAFYLLPSRFWELSFGSILAIYRPILLKKTIKWEKSYSVLSLLGLALIFSSFILINGDEGISWHNIFPVIGTVLFISFSEEKNIKKFSLIRSKIFVFIGKISYSLYLWHWPILLFLRESNIEHQIELTIICTILVSISSYFFIETPMRKKTNPITQLLLLIIVTLTISSTYALRKANLETSSDFLIKWEGPFYSPLKVEERINQIFSDTMDGITIKRRYDKDYQLRDGGLIKHYGGLNPNIMLLGDSHALMWAPVIDEISMEHNITVSFCALHDISPYVFKHKNIYHKKPYNYDIIENIKKWKPLVVLSSRWSHSLDKKLLQNTVDLIIQCGCNLIIIEQPPEISDVIINLPATLHEKGVSLSGELDYYLPASKKHDLLRDRQILSEISNQYLNCHLLMITDLFINDSSKVKVKEGMKILYIDDDHLSTDGAYLAKERLTSLILKLLTKD